MKSMKAAKKPGGRPKKAPEEKLEQFSVRLPPKLKFGLEMLARAQHRSLSQAVEWAVQVGLRAHEFRGESDYVSIGQLLDEVWELSEYQRIVQMHRYARSLLTFEEVAAHDLAMRSIEVKEAFDEKDHTRRKARLDDLNQRIENIWPRIKDAAAVLANEGYSVEGCSLELLEKFDAREALERSGKI